MQAMMVKDPLLLHLTVIPSYDAVLISWYPRRTLFWHSRVARGGAPILGLSSCCRPLW